MKIKIKTDPKIKQTIQLQGQKVILYIPYVQEAKGENMISKDVAYVQEAKGENMISKDVANIKRIKSNFWR